MIGALLTTVFFSLSAIFANRSLRAVGVNRANLGRLLFGALCLGLYAHIFGAGLNGAGRNWFLLSGVIGMGLGDLALFMALPRLGSRLTVLTTQCLAAPIAALAEWLWLGTTLTRAQAVSGLVVLIGVTVALLPSRQNPPRVAVTPLGFLFGFLSACGQGFGAVISRKANAVTLAASHPIDGLTAAYQRIAGGLFFTLTWLLLVWFLRRQAETPVQPKWTWKNYRWIPANAICGAVIGVSCYQWSLATTPSGIVLPIVATTPLVIVPLSYWLEGEHPTRRSLTGGAIAVAGAVALAVAR